VQKNSDSFDLPKMANQKSKRGGDVRSKTMKKIIHQFLRGSNNSILQWIKYWDIFDDCWE